MDSRSFWITVYLQTLKSLVPHPSDLEGMRESEKTETLKQCASDARTVADQALKEYEAVYGEVPPV